MSRKLSAIVILVCIILFIYILLQSRKENDIHNNQACEVWDEIDSVRLMAEMENKIARTSKTGGGKSDTGNEPEYTKLFPDLYTEYNRPKEMDEKKKVIYITFDDGPSNNTFKVLDILEEMDVKATFFVVGNAISKEGEVCLKRMINEGHTIGIHTYSHVCSDIYCSIERYLKDFNKVYQQIYDITGVRVNIYRFPYGSNNYYCKRIKNPLIEEMERRGFSCYDWNIDSRDSVGRPTVSSIKRNIMKDLGKKNYQIILMHDSMNRSLAAQALPDLIRTLRKKGYEFDTLDNRKPYLFEW